MTRIDDGVIGVFARAGSADIDRSLPAGLSVAGKGCGRAVDRIARAGPLTRISTVHRWPTNVAAVRRHGEF